MAGPFKVIFGPEAAAEVTTITAWWRKNRSAAPGLFRIELKQVLLKIGAHPEVGVLARLRNAPDVRAVIMRRTRYIVFYDVDQPAAEIHVLRVRHGKRRPLSRVTRL